MRSFAFVSMLAVLSGCAQVFEGNLFENIDPPPPLSSSAMADASLEDIQNQLADPNSASAFFEQLQDNPNALAALQGNLENQYTDSSATTEEVVEAAQALVLVTAYGTNVSTTVNDAIEQASNINSGGSSAASDAILALMAGKTQAQIEAELTQFHNMQLAFKAMQDKADDGRGQVNSALFFGTASAATQGDLAQIALVTAAADALIQDYGTVTALARAIIAGGSLTTGSNMTAVTNALNSPQDPSTNNYAYLSAVTGIVTFLR